MTEQATNMRYAMDFITMYNIDLWGLKEYNQVYDPDSLPVEDFWDKALDIIGESGIEGVEITGGLSHWRNAIKRYKTAEGFASALGQRSLELCSGFYTGMTLVDGKRNNDAWQRPERQKEILDEVAEYAQFIRGAGADIMVMGLPQRRLWNADEPLIVGGEYARTLADFVNQMGLVARQNGVRLALHAAAGSVFWFRRDIDLFLSLTDPVYIDFCPDTAQIMVGGTNPIDVLADHYQRVSITHWKDVRGASKQNMSMDILAAHQEMYVRVGTGAVDWQGWSRGLRDFNYQGWAIIELDAAPDPAAELRAAREYLDTATGHIYR